MVLLCKTFFIFSQNNIHIIVHYTNFQFFIPQFNYFNLFWSYNFKFFQFNPQKFLCFYPEFFIDFLWVAFDRVP